MEPVEARCSATKLCLGTRTIPQAPQTMAATKGMTPSRLCFPVLRDRNEGRRSWRVHAAELVNKVTSEQSARSVSGSTIDGERKHSRGGLSRTFFGNSLVFGNILLILFISN